MATNDDLYGVDLAARMRLAIPPGRLLFSLVLAAFAIAVMGGLANFAMNRPQADFPREITAILNRVDIGHEPSLVQWFSSIQLAAAAIIAAVLGFTYARKNRVDARYWMFIAGVMIALSIDEAIMVHEMANRAMELLVPSTSAFHFSWTIPAIFTVGVVAIVLLSFLWRLNSRTRNLFLLSGCCFVGGAVGMELVSGLAIEFWRLSELPSGEFQSSTAIGAAMFAGCQTVEEFLEMIGVSIFIFAAYEHLLISFRLQKLATDEDDGQGQDHQTIDRRVQSEDVSLIA